MTGSAQGTNGRSEPRAERSRFSSRRKTEATLRLLRGEELDARARQPAPEAAKRGPKGAWTDTTLTEQILWMLQADSGVIVNTASIAGMAGVPG